MREEGTHEDNTIYGKSGAPGLPLPESAGRRGYGTYSCRGRIAIKSLIDELPAVVSARQRIGY